jgi:hypothetical protein
MRGAYQIAEGRSKASSRELARFLAKQRQLLSPMVGQAECAVDELVIQSFGSWFPPSASPDFFNTAKQFGDSVEKRCGLCNKPSPPGGSSLKQHTSTSLLMK